MSMESPVVPAVPIPTIIEFEDTEIVPVAGGPTVSVNASTPIPLALINEIASVVIGLN